MVKPRSATSRVAGDEINSAFGRLERGHWRQQSTIGRNDPSNIYQKAGAPNVRDETEAVSPYPANCVAVPATTYHVTSIPLINAPGR